MSRAKYNSAVSACIKAYSKDGVQGAINQAEKLGYTTLRYCPQCETEQPAIVETFRLTGQKTTITTCDCAVCGSNTITPSPSLKLSDK